MRVLVELGRNEAMFAVSQENGLLSYLCVCFNCL
jgi:hypothetical protein